MHSPRTLNGMLCRSARCALHLFLTLVPLVCLALLLTGCGGKSGSGGGSSYSQSVVITVQPLSQTVPLGEMATFAVTATGTPPLSYQWSENGTEIPGATSASYSTPAITLGENASTSIGSFQVTVSNASSSAASNTVTLSAGPRSPKPGDLRYLLFQQVDVPGLGQDSGEDSGVMPASTISAEHAVGTPLSMGSSDACDPELEYDCAWSCQYPRQSRGLDCVSRSKRLERGR
ncbi:MAG: immunoglobulin domain-containing protein [Terracidiphilus sp.]